MENGKPLVSVVVISYHAQDTILETLNSIYAQTYKNIELIISDDCSADDTVSTAQQWAVVHASRFADCIVHANAENLGVPGNINAGIQQSKGEYIKVIAADDLLLPECIEKCVAFCLENNCDNVSSRVHTFCMEDGQKVPCAELSLDTDFFQKDSAGQYRDMLVEHRIISPTFFVTRALLNEMGLYDTRYRYMEDYPMNLNLTRTGHRLYFLDDYTVEYRLSASSLSNSTSGRAVHPGFHMTMKKFFYRERFFPLLRFGLYKRAFSLMRKFLCDDLILLLGNDLQKSAVRFLVRIRDLSTNKRGAI